MKFSIRTKLILAILLPLLAVYCGVLVGNYFSARREVVRQAERYLIQLTANDAAGVDEIFHEAQQVAISIAALAAEQSPGTLHRRADAMLRGVVLSESDFQSAMIYLEPADEVDDANAVKAAVAAGVKPDQAFGRFVNRQLRRPHNARAPHAGKGPRQGATKGGGGPRMGEGPKGRRKGAEPPPTTRPTTQPTTRRAVDLSDPDDANGEPAPPGPGEVYAQSLRRGDLVTVMPDFDSQTWYFDAQASGRPIWTEPLVDDKVSVVPVCRCVAPILRDGRFIGAVAVDVSVRSLRRSLSDTKLQGGYCMLVSAGGLVVSHPDKLVAMHETLADLAKRENRPELAQLALAMADGKSQRVEMDDFYTRRQSWVVFAPVRSNGWSLAAVIPRWRILAPINDWLRRDSAVMIGGLGLIVFVVTMVSVRITRPIGRLVSAVRVLGGGDLRTRVGGTHRRDEFGELSRAFNGMVRALAHHVKARVREASARRAVESELQVAREIQISLLPASFPGRPELDLHAMIVPAKEVAGDFYDFFFVADHVLAVVIGDVSGKGVPASIFMAVSRTVIRDQAMAGLSPAEVLNRANRLLAQGNERMMFVTLFLAYYDVRTGRCVFANAGHNPPCISNGSGAVRTLGEPTGPLLGVFEEERYSQRQITLEPGDSVVLYTDGVTEALDDHNRQFRLEHLARIVADNPTASPEEICGLVVQSVETHSGGNPQQDDVTMLVLRRKA